ncbi:MAG TPA: hypothetical protein VEA63_07465, partial [Opitutus sp.]|nr:hypothetical protein [Opitutus sp.]
TGAAAAITADFSADPALNQITRMSFIDLDNDIVQVELSGPGTLSLVLDGATPPALPTRYKQEINYMKGHAGIVIVGADESTHVSVFSVGRATAYDPTGAFNFLQPIDPITNNPDDNRNPLFEGRTAADYDGIADIAFIAISSPTGKFGGVRTANTTYFADHGLTGIYAPGIAFSGPVYIGDITAFDDAEPVIILGSAADTRITGGSLDQPNDHPVEVGGVTQLIFTPGTDSHGRFLPAKTNQASLRQNSQDVTAQIVVNPQ